MSFEQTLAEGYRLRVTRISCGTPKLALSLHEIVGRTGTIAGQWQGRGVVIIQRPTAKTWNFVRRTLERAGLEIHQDGDTEGSMLFDPSDKRQVRAAIKAAGIRQRRELSPEERERLVARLQKGRNSQKQAPSAPRIDEREAA